MRILSLPSVSEVCLESPKSQTYRLFGHTEDCRGRIPRFIGRNPQTLTGCRSGTRRPCRHGFFRPSTPSRSRTPYARPTRGSARPPWAFRASRGGAGRDPARGAPPRDRKVGDRSGARGLRREPHASRSPARHRSLDAPPQDRGLRPGLISRRLESPGQARGVRARDARGGRLRDAGTGLEPIQEAVECVEFAPRSAHELHAVAGRLDPSAAHRAQPTSGPDDASLSSRGRVSPCSSGSWIVITTRRPAARGSQEWT